ncbi:hypothetical protein ADUPG1_002903, partial [Aduncisulcus paluster]
MVESGHTVESGDSSDGEGVIAPIKHIDETGESVDNAPHGVNVTIAVSDTTPKDLFSSKNPSSSTAVAAEMQAVVSNEQALSADDHDSMSADDHDSISADDHDSMSTDDHESMSAGHECPVDLDVGVHTHSVAKSDERVVSQDPIQEPVPAKHSTPIEHQVATKSDSVAAESSEHVYDVDDSVSVNVSN